jgi:hypothetical protein
MICEDQDCYNVSKDASPKQVVVPLFGDQIGLMDTVENANMGEKNYSKKCGWVWFHGLKWCLYRGWFLSFDAFLIWEAVAFQLWHK